MSRLNAVPSVGFSSDLDAPASEVFRIEQIPVPKIKNGLRVVGSLFLALVTCNNMPAPSSKQFAVFLDDKLLTTVGWVDGTDLVEHFNTLSAEEFAGIWIQSTKKEKK